MTFSALTNLSNGVNMVPIDWEGAGSPSSDGFTEAVTQVDRTTVYSSGAGDRLQDKEDR